MSCIEVAKTLKGRLTTNDLKSLREDASIFFHVWADGIRDNMNGVDTPVILARPDTNMGLALLVHEAAFEKSRLVFQPKKRLQGFGGRVMSWLEARAGDVIVKPTASTKEMPFMKFYDMVRHGELTVAHLRA